MARLGSINLPIYTRIHDREIEVGILTVNLQITTTDEGFVLSIEEED